MFAFISFMKFLDWNENKIDNNLFIAQFVIRLVYICGDPHKPTIPANIKSLSELIE